MSVIKNDQLFSEQSLLSPDAGNLLEARNNGLYCGNGSVASSTAKDIYVDLEEGNDSNPGTKERPFRTLVNALKSMKVVGNYIFHLRENQRHQLDDKESVLIPGGEITFQPYSKAHNGRMYALNVTIDFKPKGMFGTKADSPHGSYDGTDLYWEVITVRNPTVFTFFGIKIQLHEHERFQYVKNHTFNSPTHEHMSAFGKSRYSSIGVRVIVSSIHFNYDENDAKKGLVGCFINGSDIVGSLEIHHFDRLKDITGHGSMIANPNISTMILVPFGNLTTDNLGHDDEAKWQKYFSEIQVDSKGNLNCLLDVRFREYVKGYRS